MNTRPHDEKSLLDIGHNLKIGINKSDIWQVWAKNGGFELIEIIDFYRVIVLLEHPYLKIKEIFNEYLRKIDSNTDFPFWKIVGAGLMSQSDEWASLALVWYVFLAEAEKAMLVNMLENVVISKWASQKSRQLAHRYLKESRSGTKQIKN